MKKQRVLNKILKEQPGQDHEKNGSSKNMSKEEKVRNIAKGRRKVLTFPWSKLKLQSK